MTFTDQVLQGTAAQLWDSQTLQSLRKVFNDLALKAGLLRHNLTTNAAEGFMNIRCHFDGNKAVNRAQRGSWTYRCYGML